MANALNEVYEPRFLDCSYGFRPGRSAHDVVRYIDQTIMRRKVNYVLEADIKGFFDNVDHDWLMKFLEHDIQDKNFLRYVKRFKMLNRRSQRKSMGYDKFRRIWHYYIKPPKITKNIWNGTPRNA